MNCNGICSVLFIAVNFCYY